MEKERLFELIRKEEVILFAGAGLSMYAGYPSGKDLAQIMHSGLTPSQQKQVDLTSDLLQVTQDIYTLKSNTKNYLIEILKEQFQKDPICTDTHQLLAKIPQIKTIITTNYDNLFEDSNKNLQIIRRSKDYPISNFKKPLLFKIHGDLSDAENIILTKSDYNNFFIDNKEKSVFWNAVKDKLATNHILFVGYSLEDTNVLVMLERILKELGEHRKEIFFVAPTIAPLAAKSLNAKGIEIIQCTGEEIIKEIFTDLKLNYFPGLSRGNGSADIAFNFANSNEISLELEKKQNNLFVKNLVSKNGAARNEYTLKFELPDHKKDKVLDALYGRNFDDVIFDKNSVKQFSHFFNSIRISNDDDVTDFRVIKLPNIHGNFDIIFADGYELDNYKMEIFIINPKDDLVQLKILINDFTIRLDFTYNYNKTLTKVDLQILPNEVISNVKSGLNFYNVLSRITDNVPFEIYKDSKRLFAHNNIIDFGEDPFDAKLLLGYFEKLKKIETFHQVNFKGISEDMVNFDVANILIAHLENSSARIFFDELIFKNKTVEDLLHMLKTCDDQGEFLIRDNEKTVLSLHNLKFDVGFLTRYVQDGYIKNSEDIRNNLTNTMILKSRSNSIIVQFKEQ